MTPYEYFRNTLAGLDDLYLEYLSRFGSGHPITQYVWQIREECEVHLQNHWYIG